MQGFINFKMEVYSHLESGVHSALETYSNVHRGSGHNSQVTTFLYEKARDIVLEHLGLDKAGYVVIFCNRRRAEILKSRLKSGRFQVVSTNDIGLPLGVTAMVMERKALPGGIPFQTGGGTTVLVSQNWVVWADAPDRYEAGTPAIINVIAFAIALRLINRFGKDIFRNKAEKLSADEILYHDELDGSSGQQLLDELRKTLIASKELVPTTEGPKPFINLDNAASTPTFEPVWNAVCRMWRQSGQINKEIVNEVRSICFNFLGTSEDRYEIIFTSNTTEAINLSAESLSREYEKGSGSIVLNTLIEHNSNDLPWRMYPGISLIRMNADDNGLIDLTELESLLQEYNEKNVHGNKRIRLMAVSGASNVLGVFNDLEGISRIVHKYGVRLLVDAAQMVAHRKIGVEQLGIDYLAFSAHKAYAPFGTGVLIVRKGLLKYSQTDRELILSSGEENAAGIAALGKVLLLFQRIGLDLIQKEEQALTRKALKELSKVEGLTIYGIKDPDSPAFKRKGGVIVFSFKNIYSNVIAKKLAENGGIGIRYGCHCSHILIKHLVGVGPFLRKFQHLMASLYPRIKFPGLARVSFGIENKSEDVDSLISTLNKIARLPRTMGDGHIRKAIDDFVKSAAERIYSES